MYIFIGSFGLLIGIGGILGILPFRGEKYFARRYNEQVAKRARIWSGVSAVLLSMYFLAKGMIDPGGSSWFFKWF